MAVHFLNEQARMQFSENRFLYRIFAIDRFIDFLNGKLVFVSPTLWSDPYEKAFLEVKYHYNGQEFYHPLNPKKSGNRVFAQCWTGNKQTEAMWRGFAPHNDGVMVKISGSNFLDILNEISDRGTYDYYIGKVYYEDTERLYLMKSQHRVWEDISQGEISKSVLDLLLKKREAFNFEDEFRILALKKSDNGNKSKIMTVSADNLLNRVEYLKFDPRMGEKFFQFTKQTILQQFPNLEIHKSRLYSKPLKNLTFGGEIPREVNDEIISLEEFE